MPGNQSPPTAATGLPRRQVTAPDGLPVTIDSAADGRSTLEAGPILAHLVNRLAHLIKNPMTTIGTFLQMLPDNFDEQRFRTEYLEIALEEYFRINALIDTLLDVVEEKALSLAWADLGALIRDRVQAHSEQVRKKGLTLDVVLPKSPLAVFIDVKRIETVVTNLIQNALEATPIGGSIRIEATTSLGPKESEVIHICVSDTGPGIAEDNLPDVFTPFATTKQASIAEPCTGLGLYLARQFVLAHGGAIWCSSRPEEGARFTLKIPAVAGGSTTGALQTCASDP